MKTAIITGFVGSGTWSEALEREHDITAIERNLGESEAHPKLTPVY